MPKHVLQDTLWAGTEPSLHAFRAAAEGIATKMSAGMFPEDEDDEKDLPSLLSVSNGIGTVSIHGALTNTDSPWNQMFGITSYNEIREALMYAAAAEDVNAIVLDINSGGGAVSGVDDAAKLISMIDKNVKPVVSYTDGAMASAAYWLGSSAREVYASNVAVVGSIGVLTTHTEHSKRLKEEGVGVTVIRSGKYKALANGVEPLSSDARAQIQSQLDVVYQIFLGHVANARGKSLDYADANMAQGREFIGQQALGASLVDGIESFDSLMSKLQKRFGTSATQGSTSGTTFTQGTPTMKKHAMTEPVLAAIAAGIPVEAATQVEGQTAAVEQSAEGEGVAAVETEAAAAPVEESPKADASLVAYLQGEVKAKSDALIEAQIEARDLKNKLAGMEATHTGLVDIVGRSLNQMRIALGGSATDLTGMDAAVVLAEHARVSADFKASFKAGGVAAVDTTQPQESGQGPVDALTQARLAAVRFTSKGA